MGVLNRLKNLIPTNAKLQLFKSAILPHLTYCSTIWNFCKSSDRRKLERVQERALRVIFKDSSSSYDNLLDKARLPSLENRRLQDIAILMFKVKNGMCPDNIKKLFKFKTNNYDLRNHDFVIPRVNTTVYGKHSIRYLRPSLWAKIDKNIRPMDNLGKFKRSVRRINLVDFIRNNCRGCILCNCLF